MQHHQQDASQKEKPVKSRKSIFESVFDESYVPFEELFDESYLGHHRAAISSEYKSKTQRDEEK